ncbi:MAG: DUF1569 domain-containing protein [Terracidiphilus sp.]
MKRLDQPNVKRDIVERIARLRPDLEGRWGRMNARQMVSHLNDAFMATMGLKAVPIDPNFRWRGFYRWCALYLPTHWPHGFPTRPEIDQELSGTAPGDFEADRQTLLALVERFTRRPRDFDFQPHPMFLEMTEWQWMRWGYLHTDHHLRQFGV